jgi:shikimate kinase
MGNLFLVGLMGAGKTTVGRRLATHYGLVFHDTDHVIVDRTGVSIPTIFEVEGEAGFRQREAGVIDELSALDGIVLATGGGAVLSESNRALLHARGTVIYLHAQPEELYQRTRHDKNRPLLQTDDPLGRLKELYAERDPLYRACAHWVVDTGRQSIAALIRRIEGQLGTQATPGGDGAIAAG